MFSKLFVCVKNFLKNNKKFKLFLNTSLHTQAGLDLKIAVVQTAYANGSSTHYLEKTMKVKK